MFGKEVDLQCTSSGHYCVPLDEPQIPVNDTEQVLYNMSDKPLGEKKKIVQKWHR